MKNKTKYLLSTLFIALTILLVNPSNVFANHLDFRNVGTYVGPGIPSQGPQMQLSGSLAPFANKSGSYIYLISGDNYMCVSADNHTPRGSGSIYSYSVTTKYQGGNAGLERLVGYSFSKIAYGIYKYSFNNLGNGNKYIIGHAILSALMTGDNSLYSDIYGISGVGPGLISDYLDDLFNSSAWSQAANNSTFYMYIPDDFDSSSWPTQALITIYPPETKIYGGVAVKKSLADGSTDLSGYDFELWEGDCGTGTKVGDFTTDAYGLIQYFGTGTSAATSNIPSGTPFCFKEKTNASGYATKNHGATVTEYKPATFNINVLASPNPTVGGALGELTNTKTQGNKGYISIRKTVSASNNVAQELDGYSYVVYHMPCSQVTSTSPGTTLRTDSYGIVEYGKDATGAGQLNIGDTYCVLEQTGTCANDATKNTCAQRWKNGAWSHTTFEPQNNPQDITVNSTVNYASFLNSDTPEERKDKFCWLLGKYMEDYVNGESVWIPLTGVAFRMTHYELHYGYEDRPTCEIGTLYTDSDGELRWNWDSLDQCTPSHTTRDIKDYTITESPGRAAGWYRYLNGRTGQLTPYLYSVSGVGTSGPSIDTGGYVGGWNEANLRVADNNNDGLGWNIQTDRGSAMPTDVDGITCGTHQDTTAINTKVYFCLRVKKEDENGETIDPTAFSQMKFSATNGTRTITTDDADARINPQTGVVSFFTGDSDQTIVTEGGPWVEDTHPMCTVNDRRHNGEMCNSPGGMSRLIPADWTVTEVAPPEGYTLNTDTVLTVKPTQMKAYYYKNTGGTSYERAREDCLSGGTSDGETFSPYKYDSDKNLYVDADNYTKINDLTVNNPDESIRNQYIIKNKKLVLQWFKRATDDPDTTPNDEAQLNGATFVARRQDGGVDGKAYAVPKDLNNDGRITLDDDRQLTKDSNGVEKYCFVVGSYQATAPNKYFISGDVSKNHDGSMPGEVCLANVNTSKTNPNYVITEIDSADSHTFGANKDKVVATTKFFVSRNDTNTIYNYSTEFEFLKRATAYDEFTNEEIANMMFSIFRQGNDGQATGDPISLYVAGNGVYDYLRGDNPTTILHVRASDLKFVVKHLPKGNYVVKEMVGNTCEDNTDPSTCIGYYIPTNNDQRFTITNCSSNVATACGSGNYGRVTANILNTPTEIKFTKADFYHEYDQSDVAIEGNNVPAEFANDKERSDFDRIVFTLYDKDGTPLKLQFVGNHGDCTTDDSYAEYRYARGGTVGSTELHTCGGHIRITHLCRGRSYTIKEESVPENSVFVRESTDSTPTEQTYQVACDEGEATRPTTETKLIVDKPTRVTFEKRDAKYNYLIPDETTTFEVYRCPKGQECHPGDYSSVEAREAAGMELVKFYPRGVIANDEEDPGVQVYKMMSFSDAKNKSVCTGNSTNNCYVTSVHPNVGKLIFRYLASGSNYVLLETVAPKNYLLPDGRKAETAFTVRTDTVSVDYVDVPNQPTGILIRKYDDEGNLLGGAKFRVKRVTNYNPNKKAQDQEAELLKFKTIKQGVYEYRPVLDSDLVITCEGPNCSDTSSFSYDKNWSNFDTLLTSSGEMIKDVLKEGTALIQYLEYGNYYVIEEVEAPKGHSLPANEDDRFTLIHIGENTTVIEDTEMKFVNLPTPFTFYKFDEYNDLLDGAKFKLQKLNDNKSYVTLNVTKVEGEDSLYKVDPESTNDLIETTNGKATVYYLEAGQYRIVEVEPAPGKELPKKTINVATFFVDDDGNVFGENIIANKAPTEKKTVKPKASATLMINIDTGQNIVKYGLIIAVLVAAITGLMIFIKKRK